MHSDQPFLLSRGQILYWLDSKEKETGKIGNKFFVLLGISKDWALLSITTSNQHNKERSHGCRRGGEYFFIKPSKHTWFDRDTWVLLQGADLYSQSTNYLLSLVKQKKIIHSATLPNEVAGEIVNCLRGSPHLPPVVVEEFFSR